MFSRYASQFERKVFAIFWRCMVGSQFNWGNPWNFTISFCWLSMSFVVILNKLKSGQQQTPKIAAASWKCNKVWTRNGSVSTRNPPIHKHRKPFSPANHEVPLWPLPLPLPLPPPQFGPFCAIPLPPPAPFPLFPAPFQWAATAAHPTVPTVPTVPEAQSGGQSASAAVETLRGQEEIAAGTAPPLNSVVTNDINWEFFDDPSFFDYGFD
jgi:hypothetical protein